MRFPADSTPTPLNISYDEGDQERAIKQFPNVYAARRFYREMDAQGRNPQVSRSESMSPQVTSEASVETQPLPTVLDEPVPAAEAAKAPVAKKQPVKKVATKKTLVAKKETALQATKKTPTKKVEAKKTPAKKSPAPKKAKKPATAKKESDSHDGSIVGFKAKCAEDVKWSEKKVAFYLALKKIGGSGTSVQIAKASNGKINAGNARHFGYHGVGGGLIKIAAPEDENQRAFQFQLTAKGRALDYAAALAKQNEAKAK